MKKPLNVRKKFFEQALRSAGYSNYSAIADLLDNSLENEVDSKNVDIVVGHNENDKKITSVSIVDDGVGMSLDTLEEAMSLGSETDKNEDNLGMYGTGLKTASLSMGRRFSVFTKKDDSNVLLKAVFDIDDYDYENETFNVSYTQYNEGTVEYDDFCTNVNGNHGTIVKIDKLDRLSGSKYCQQFVGTLKKNLRVIFNKFIENGYCDISINGEKLKPFDVIGNKTHGNDVVLMQTGEIEIDGVYATYKAWNIKKLTGDAKDDDDSYGRGSRHQGLFIYRKNRLVGEALTLGLYYRDPWYDGFRFELFVDGNADKIFHTNFTKTINEKNKGAIDQAWADKLTEIIKPLLRIVKDDQKAMTKNADVSNTIKENVSKALRPLNADNLLKKGLQTRGRNEKRGETGDGKTEHKKQEHPNQHKTRKEEWIRDWKFVQCGETGLMFRSVIEDNHNYMYINTDHVFYKEIFSKLSDDMMRKVVVWLTMDIQAKQRMDYYFNDDTQRIVDEYIQRISDSLRTAFTGIG